MGKNAVRENIVVTTRAEEETRSVCLRVHVAASGESRISEYRLLRGSIDVVKLETDRITASLVEKFYGDIRREVLEIKKATMQALSESHPSAMHECVRIVSRFDDLLESLS